MLGDEDLNFDEPTKDIRISTAKAQWHMPVILAVWEAGAGLNKDSLRFTNKMWMWLRG